MYPRDYAVSAPSRPAVVMTGSGDTLTYDELERQANRIAHLMRARGLRPGDVIAVMMENCTAFFPICWAAQRTGLYWTPVSSHLLGEELAYIINDSGARILFTSAKFADVAREIAASRPDLGVLIARGAVQGFETLDAAIAGCPDTPVDDEAQGTDMLYSSGTTGRPKGIRRPLPAGPIDTPTALLRLVTGLFGIAPGSRYLCPAPLYHAAPLRWSMAIQSLGGTVFVMEKFDPEQALKVIADHRIQAVQFVPTHFVRMLKLDPDVRARYDITSLRTVVHAAAPCPVEVKRAMIEWFGPVIHEYYSSTEANGLTAIDSPQWLAHPGSVGRAYIGTLHICDADGEPVGPRVEGRIFFEGGAPVDYHNDPEKTAASHNRHGWSMVGDIGWVDEDGFLYLTDRTSYMIISGGVNIYPQEIEDRLIAHPKIADAAVVGAPDADLGERVVAVVRPADPADAGDALAEELRTHLRGLMSPLKVPRQFDFVDSLPRQETGKLNKRLLRDAYRARADAAAAPSTAKG